jgi:hypothetical protein
VKKLKITKISFMQVVFASSAQNGQHNSEIVELGVRRFGLPLQFEPPSLGLTEAETLPGNDGAELPDSLAEQGLDPGRSPANYQGMVAEPPRPVRPLHFAVSAG